MGAFNDLASSETRQPPPPPPTRAGEFTLASTVDVPDSDLMRAFGELHGDPQAQDAITAIFEWRDARDAERDAELAAAQEAARAELETNHLAPATDFDPITNPARRGRFRQTVEQRVRQEYDCYTHSMFLRAEDDCRGNLCNAEGRAKKIDPLTLFSGNPLRAKRYASEELIAWWRANGRLSYAAFRGQQLDRDSDRAAVLRARIEDFGGAA